MVRIATYVDIMKEMLRALSRTSNTEMPTDSLKSMIHRQGKVNILQTELVVIFLFSLLENVMTTSSIA